MDIEELRGLEFHQLMQDTQSVEDVRIQLQRLAQKAFPKSGAKEFDRMLKGRFYQALLPKWQRKLGAPKPSESFDDLYARARAYKNDMISKSMHVSLERKHPNKKDPRRSTPSQLVGPRHTHLDLRARVPTSLSRGQEGVSTAVISITMRGTVPKREVRLKPRGSLAKCLLSPLRW